MYIKRPWHEITLMQSTSPTRQDSELTAIPFGQTKREKEGIPSTVPIFPDPANDSA